MSMSWILILVGLAISVTTLLAAIGVLRPNGLLGIRTPATRQSEEAWKAGHTRAAMVTAPVGIAVAVFGLGRILGWPLLSELPEVATYVGIALAVAATLAGSAMASSAAKAATSR